MKVKVRAMPAQGFDVRRRAGLVFTREATELEVVEKPDPQNKKQISPQQWAAIKGDEMLAASEANADEGVILAAQGEIAKVQAELLEAKRQLAQAGEASDLQLREAETQAKAAFETIQKLQHDLEQLRAHVKKHAPKLLAQLDE